MENKYIFKHNDEEIKVFLPELEIDKETMKQIKKIADKTVLTNMRFMPDCHKGVGCCIGTTGIIEDKIVPGYVGVDIGCGISMYYIGKNIRERRYPHINKIIHTCVPMGEGKFSIFTKSHIETEDWEWLLKTSNCDLEYLKICWEDYEFPEKYTYDWIVDMIKRVRGNLKRDLCSIGTLGGGNHYVEVNKDDEDNFYLTVHSGSRNLGSKVCGHHQYKINGNSKINMDKYNRKVKLIKRKTKDSKERYELEEELKKKMQSKLHTPYLEKQEMIDYFVDMIICQHMATLNRAVMIRNIVRELGVEFNRDNIINTKHNYIDFDRFILRKGSISAEEGEKCIISLNMRDGILLCVGKGNADWNYSSAHGCGRIMTRHQASRLNLKEFIKTMEDVYSTSVCKETLDESPMAYRDINLIKECLCDSVIILKQLKPVINCKGF